MGLLQANSAVLLKPQQVQRGLGVVVGGCEEPAVLVRRFMRAAGASSDGRGEELVDIEMMEVSE